MGDALVNAMAFFAWRQSRFPRYLARLSTRRAGRSFSRPPFSVCVSGLTKTQAEDLLDWLEATGRRQRELTYSAEKGFSVFYG
jgi:hypothetical protein